MVMPWLLVVSRKYRSSASSKKFTFNSLLHWTVVGKVTKARMQTVHGLQMLNVQVIMVMIAVSCCVMIIVCLSECVVCDDYDVFYD
jgi:hypothetical protein